MKIACIALAAGLLAGPAFAGNPQSTGLTHTEAQARRALATVVVRHENARCLKVAADSVSSLPGLQQVSVREGALQATFKSSGKADEAQAALQASVATACAGEAATASTPAS